MAGVHPSTAKADKKALRACAVFRLFCYGLCLEGDSLRRALEADRGYRESLKDILELADIDGDAYVQKDFHSARKL